MPENDTIDTIDTIGTIDTRDTRDTLDVDRGSFVVKRIQPLPRELSNQIAAGEVVERPASVLKELLENSLDAQSTRIDIVIEKGGVGLIQVQDNGSGIHPDDLPLALTEHATSKISKFTDLEAIASFGFRGEALASIASVAKMKMTSCCVDQAQGTCIEKSGRDPNLKIYPAPRILGTSIEVRDLFYNTPARKHFLRSERTEMTYIEEVFKRIALSHPEVAFSLKLPGKQQKKLHRCLTQESFKRRVAEICGKTFIEQAHYVEAESNGLMLKGWVGDKDHLRAAADLQYFYVNGRIIRDKVINHALRQAYQESYALGRYPGYILFLELDPARVDVNVHPTKHEVRFREARIVHAFLTFALAGALAESSAAKHSPLQKRQEPDTRWERFSPHSVMTQKTSLYSKASRMPVLQENREQNSEMTALPQTFTEFDPHIQASEQKPVHESNTKPEAKTLLLGELFILEHQDEIVVVDIKACHEYLVLEQLKWQNQKHRLFIPQSVKIHDYRTFSKAENILKALGFHWTESGKDQILLREVPECLSQSKENLERLFQEMYLQSEVSLSSIKYSIAQYIVAHCAYTQIGAASLYSEFLKTNPSAFDSQFSKIHKKYRVNTLKKLLL